MSVSIPNIIGCLAATFGSAVSSQLSRSEQKIVASLTTLLHQVETGESSFDSYEETIAAHDLDDVDWTGEEPEDDENFEAQVNSVVFGGMNRSIDEVKRAIKYAQEVKTKKWRSLSSVSASFKFIKNDDDYRKLKTLAAKDEILSTKASILRQLSKELETTLLDMMSKGITIHDVDIGRIALTFNADTFGIKDFKASARWITNFKRSHRFCSRRITKIVTKKSLRDEAATLRAASENVAKVRLLMHNVGHANTWNADQCGINKFCKTMRTIALIGERNVERLVESSTAVSHSSTLMPWLKADGTLGSKLFVVLQEPGGTFPKKGHKNCPNLVVRAGTSHIMTKRHMVEWIQECILPEMPDHLLLLIDSWTSFKDHDLIQSLVPAGKKLTIKNIPPGATCHIQPCDVFFFRLFKGYIKRISNHVIMHDIPVVLSKRDNLLSLYSLVYRQFCSPVFEKFLRYPWIKAGYIDQKEDFETPSQVCFPSIICFCAGSGCIEYAFIRCAWCGMDMCFKHFFDDYHYTC